MALLVFAPWAAGQLPDWSEREVVRVVTDSPWARRVTVPMRWKKQERRALLPREIPGADPVHERTGSGLGPLGGIGAPPKDHLPNKAELIIRWASALPVRQAKTLFTKKVEMLNEFGKDYTLEIFGVPSELAHLGAENVESVAMGGVVLRTKGGRVIKPRGAKVIIAGEQLTIFVHFPRGEALELEDDFVQVDGDFQIFGFAQRFALKKMVLAGKLEI